MPESTPIIENLMKVSLAIRRRDAKVNDRPGIPFEFIYGVGPAGITPFEKAFYGRRTGERIQLDIPADESCAALGHLELPLREQTGIMAPASLEVMVNRVVRAEDREVVKALAAGGSCGDCGCGCGGH